MDKNTIIGLGLIGVILFAFTYFNQPTEEELQEGREKQEQFVENVKEEVLKNKKDTVNQTIASSSETEGNIVSDSTDFSSETETPSIVEVEKEYILENEKIRITLSSKGGGVKKAQIKEYQDYQSYMKNRGTDHIDALTLFDEDYSTNGLNFTDNGKRIHTKDVDFSVVKETENSITLKADFGNGKSIEQVYSIKSTQFHLDYEVRVNGFQESVDPRNIFMEWDAKLLKTEKLLSEQRRQSTVFYKERDGSYQYLSEMKDDDKEMKTDVDWVAFKQSYFSSVMIPEKSFDKNGTHLAVSSFGDDTEEDTIYVKDYAAMMNLGMNSSADGRSHIKWYFGPNDYEVLKSYNNGMEDLLNYGWGLFRWFNIYIVQPLFNWLSGFGISMGLAIIILTFIIKTGLAPIQWKMYASSAKMKILKPEIQEINEKYPDKEDAMKKQMETMELYKATGSSPLSGCLPMLIQMPILVAVFRFFPSTFDLRQKSFLWAEDLSSYDSILDFGFNIPFYGSHVSLFTLLMAVTTLFYTIMNSGNMQQPQQEGMPNMKVISYFFPIMMIFFFNSYASGLSLYYFISTLTSILLMLMIKQFFIDEEKLRAKMEKKKAINETNKKKGGGKSKFQQRLEEMQKAQQQKLQEQKKKGKK